MNYVQELIQQAVKLEDQTVSRASKRELPPEGPTVCRFTGYVELGMQPQRPYKGQAKGPVEQVRFEFTLLNKENIHEIKIDGGETITTYDRVYMTMPKILGDKAKFKKLFNKLANGRQVTHISQLLGEAFQVKIRHEKSADGTKTYVSVQDPDGSYTFAPPVVEIPGKAEPIRLDVPEYNDIKIFIWESPTQQSWESLYIPGEYEKDGVKVSKNFIQDMIMNALDFEGSPLQVMLADSNKTLEASANKMQGDLNLDSMNV